MPEFTEGQAIVVTEPNQTACTAIYSAPYTFGPAGWHVVRLDASREFVAVRGEWIAAQA